MTPANELRPIGLVLQGLGERLLGKDEMAGPDFALLGGSWTPRGKQGAEFGHKFGDDKQLAKGGVSPVCLRCGQHDLGIGG